MIVENTEFGQIEIIPNARSRSIRVRIMHDRLKVTMPLHTKTEDALKFIQLESETIARKQKLAQKKQEHHPTRIDEKTGLKTLTFEVRIERKDRKDLHFSLRDGFLTIEFPISAEINEDNAQKHIWNGISYFLRKEAKRLLPQRTKQLADKHGFIFREIKIQPSKSRWGSCSREKNINYSLFLMLLPAHLVDYVILHELCHTREMNHGDKFWKLMDRVTDNKTYDLRRELKKYNMPK